MSTPLPDGYDASGSPDTEAVYGNPGPAAAGTASFANDVETAFTNADYNGVRTDTVTISHTVAASLHKVGITSTPAQLVVYDVTTSTPLVLTTDYTVATVSSGATKTYTITRNNSSSASADGDSVNVTYTWGNDPEYSRNEGEYGPDAVTYGTYGSSDTSNVLYPGVSTTLDNEHVGLLVGGTQPNYRAEPLVPDTYPVTETDTTTVNWPPNVAPAYRAPNLVVGAVTGKGSVDTTWTDRPLSNGIFQPDLYATVNGTLDSYYVGAPTSALTASETGTIDHTTALHLVNAGAFATSLTVVNNGKVTNTTDTITGTDFNHTTPKALAHTGVTTAAGSIVVTDTTTSHVLVSGTDYTLTASGSGATKAYTIVRIVSSTNSADNDTVTVAYTYGNTAHFTPVALTLTTDYTVAQTGAGDATATTVLRNNSSSNVADGDTVALKYSYGDSAYYESNAPASAPTAPTIGSVTAKNEGVQVAWTAPTSTVRLNGYIVENSTYGTAYAHANDTSFVFGGVSGHGTLLPNVPYQFRVAAWNDRGVGPFSAWSGSASALNDNAVPTGSLEPDNTVNPIYEPDGTIHASTPTGSGGGGPRPPQSVTVTSTVTGRVDVTWAAPSTATTPTPPEEAPSGYRITLSNGLRVTVGATVLAYNITGQTTSAVLTVTVTAVGSIQEVSAAPVSVTVH